MHNYSVVQLCAPSEEPGTSQRRASDSLQINPLHYIDPFRFFQIRLIKINSRFPQCIVHDKMEHIYVPDANIIFSKFEFQEMRSRKMLHRFIQFRSARLSQMAWPYSPIGNRNNFPHTALKWKPRGKRKRGRPLRRTVEEENKMTGKTWIEQEQEVYF